VLQDKEGHAIYKQRGAITSDVRYTSEPIHCARPLNSKRHLRLADTYVGVYSSWEVPFKLTITRDGSTLVAQPTRQPSFPLEATAQEKFKLESRGIVLEFDLAKSQMTLKQEVGPLFSQKKTNRHE
jgi:hypothetical protein